MNLKTLEKAQEMNQKLKATERVLEFIKIAANQMDHDNAVCSVSIKIQLESNDESSENDDPIRSHISRLFGRISDGVEASIKVSNITMAKILDIIADENIKENKEMTDSLAVLGIKTN